MRYHLPNKFRFLNFRLCHFANIFEREDIRSVFMVYERNCDSARNYDTNGILILGYRLGYGLEYNLGALF